MLDLSRLSCIGEALRDAMVAFKTNVALIEADRNRESGRWTYRELKHDAECFASRLQQAEFEPGERCAILMSNQSKWIISALGALWSGGVLVPLDYKLTPEEQLNLLAHARPAVLVVEFPIWRKLLAAATDELDSTLVLVTEAPAEAELEQGRRWEKAVEGEFDYRERCRDDVACIVYTSGTGGQPKGCMLTHANYLAQAESLTRVFAFNETDVFFSILPTNHAIDFMCGFVLPLMLGMSVVHQRTLRPQYLLSTMRRYRITLIALVPMILKAFESKLREAIDELSPWKRAIFDSITSVNDFATQRAPNHALSSRLLKPIHDRFGGRLRLMFCGGAFVERESAEFFYRMGLPVVIGYGMTEAGTVLTLNDLKPFRADSVGRAVPGVEVQIRAANDAGVGEVWVKGETVMAGYLDEPELTAEVLVGGWLRTGDLGRLDASGHLRLLGRAKNMIVTEGGKNVYPEDLETNFSDLDGCEEYCVFATNFVWPQATMLDEKLMIVVRASAETPVALLAEQVRKRNRHLADYKRLGAYVLWDQEFPRTASMKVKRQQLASALRETLNRESALTAL